MERLLRFSSVILLEIPTTYPIRDCDPVCVRVLVISGGARLGFADIIYTYILDGVRSMFSPCMDQK